MRSSSEPGSTERDTRAGVYRSGISSARQELQAGTARRHRRDPDAVPRSAGSIGGASSSSSSTAGGVPAPVGDGDQEGTGVAVPDLALQRAGVRAALAELRQHQGPR